MTDTDFIVIWKDRPGQQVSTVVDAHNNPVIRNAEYLSTQGISILEHKEDVLNVLSTADGYKYGITRELANDVLGWQV